MKHFLKFAGASWWFAPACVLGCALGSAATLLAVILPWRWAYQCPVFEWSGLALFLLSLLSGLWALGVAVRWAWKRLWKRSLATLLALCAAILISAAGCAGTAFLTAGHVHEAAPEEYRADFDAAISFVGQFLAENGRLPSDGEFDEWRKRERPQDAPCVSYAIPAFATFEHEYLLHVWDEGRQFMWTYNSGTQHYLEH